MDSKTASKDGSESWIRNSAQSIGTQFEEFLFGDELVVVVDGGGPALLQLLGETVEEGGPAGGRAQARHIEHLHRRDKKLGTVRY